MTATAAHAAPRHTDVRDLCASLETRMAPYATGDQTTAVADAERDARLIEFRARAARQIRHDLDQNLATLNAYADEIAGRRQRAVRDEPVITDQFRCLEKLRDFLNSTDAAASSRLEEQCWVALQQFYCDALDLAERLTDLDEGRRPGRPPSPGADGALKRHNFMGITAYRRAQACMQAAEVAIPNVCDMRFTRTLAPTIAHMLWHQVIPWGKLHWCDFERTTLGWLGKTGLARLRGEAGRGIRFEGRDLLDANPELFEGRGGQTRHNVIVAGSHRAGFLDFPLFAEMLRHTPHAVWANNAFYTPGMARKLAKERRTIPIRGHGRLPLYDAIDMTIKVLADDKVPLFIMADGSQPNMMYGHPMRVKRGIRLLVDECVRQTRGVGRRTFVLPMTFDDPLSYLLGLDDEIVVRMHPPLEIESPSSALPRTSVFDESALNGGDNLLSHLEALYLLHCMQPRHGLCTPDVLAAVKRKRSADRNWGPRAWLRARFNTSVFDLSRASRGIGGAGE